MTELLFQVQRNERRDTATVEINFEAPEGENPRDSITVEVDDSEPTDVFGLIIARALEEAGFEAYSSPDNHDWAHVMPSHGVYAEPDENGDFENWFEVNFTETKEV
jgi:hypothetical protein